jgi:hypothetical protein
MARAQDEIANAYRRFIDEVPSLEKLKLVVRLELRGRGDVQVFRVQLPGPQVTKGEPEEARLILSMPRPIFNELGTAGKLADWREAYEHGHVKVGGDPAVLKLIGTVIERHQARARTKKVH